MRLLEVAFESFDFVAVLFARGFVEFVVERLVEERLAEVLAREFVRERDEEAERVLEARRPFAVAPCCVFLGVITSESYERARVSVVLAIIHRRSTSFYLYVK